MVGDEAAEHGAPFTTALLFYVLGVHLLGGDEAGAEG